MKYKITYWSNGEKACKIILLVHVRYLCTMQNVVSFALMFIFEIYVSRKINIFYNFDFQIIQLL